MRKLTCFAVLVLAVLASEALALETITVRSGQVGGVPGSPGGLDDIITYNPWGNPVAAPVLGTPFAAADFAATAAGAPATVISPHPAWMGGVTAPLSDPLARWINFGREYSFAGSALYAVPFFVTSATIPNATLTVEGGVDDVLGDLYTGGPNPDGLYINNIPSGLATLVPTDFNFGVPTTHFQNITTKIAPGLNYLYFYQHDVGATASGLIFSATVRITPEPCSIGLAAICVLFACGRRRGRA